MGFTVMLGYVQCIRIFKALSQVMAFVLCLRRRLWYLRVCLSVSLLPAAFSIVSVSALRRGFSSPCSYPSPIRSLLGWWWGVRESAVVLMALQLRGIARLCVCVCVCVCARVRARACGFLPLPASPCCGGHTVMPLLGLSQGQSFLPLPRGCWPPPALK